jgi:hypothetical protein
MSAIGADRSAVNVRYWSLADIDLCNANVRFRGQSGHDLLRCECLLLTQSRHRRTRVRGS